MSRDFVASVHRVTRQLDEDPYCDTLWGILTGYDAKNAIEIASEEDPLTIDQVSAGTEIALSMCNQGVWYDELVQHKKVEKLSDGTIAESKGPADTTHALANSLCQESTQLFVTSGHATEKIGRSVFDTEMDTSNRKRVRCMAITTGEDFRLSRGSQSVHGCWKLFDGSH